MPKGQLSQQGRKLMSEYRRFYVPGGTYFFTVVTYQRRPILVDRPARHCLREALATVRDR